MKPASRKILIDILTPYLLPGEALRETGQAVCYIPAGGGGDATARRYLGCPSHLGSVCNVVGWLEPVRPGSTTCIFEYKSTRFGGAGWERRMAAEFLRLIGLDKRDPDDVRRARAAAKRERLTQRLASLETERVKVQAELDALTPAPTPEPAASGWRWEEHDGWIDLYQGDRCTDQWALAVYGRSAILREARRLRGPDVPALPGVTDV